MATDEHTPAPTDQDAPTRAGRPPRVTRPFYKQWWVWVAVLFLIAAGVAAVVGYNPAGGSSGSSADQPVSEGSAPTAPASTDQTEGVPAPEDPEAAAKAEAAVAELAYVGAVTTISAETKDALEQLKSLLQNDPQGVLMGSDSADEASGYSATIHQNYEKAAALEPPERFASIHAKWLSGMETFDAAMDRLDTAIEERSSFQLASATQLMVDAAKIMDETTAELEKQGIDPEQ